MIGGLAMRGASGSDGWDPGELVIAAVHLVVFVEFLVALCFVWWTTAPGNQFEPVGEHVGWSVIVSNDYYAMAASLGMLVTVVALAVRRAVPLLIAAGLAAVLALVDWYVLEHGRGIVFGFPHPAAFVGLLLVGVAAALSAGEGVLIVARRRGREVG